MQKTVLNNMESILQEEVDFQYIIFIEYDKILTRLQATLKSFVTNHFYSWAKRLEHSEYQCMTLESIMKHNEYF